MDCGRPRGDRYPHRSYSTVVEYALRASERAAALRSTLLQNQEVPVLMQNVKWETLKAIAAGGDWEACLRPGPAAGAAWWVWCSSRCCYQHQA